MLLAAADTALYQAKRSGRNRVEAAEELPLSLENWRRKTAGLPAPARAQPVDAWSPSTVSERSVTSRLPFRPYYLRHGLDPQTQSRKPP